MAPRGSGATVTAVAPADPAQTFAIMTPVDPARFYPRFRVIPATTAVRDQTGAWDAPGQTRTLLLADGSSVVENLREVDAPHRFVYELTDFTGVFGRLVDHARAEWLFDAAGSGTRVRWTYVFFAKPGRAAIVAAIVKLAWGAYMTKVMPGLIAEVGRRAR